MAVSLYRQPPTNQQSNNARSSGARSRPTVFTRRDYIMVATDRANDSKIRGVHSPHLCRTLAHRVVRVGRLLQTRPKVSGVVCHRNYCPGLLTHSSGHPSIGNCGHIQPQDSSLRLIRRPVSLASRPVPALDIPGNTSKTKGTPRKYQDEPSSWSRRRVPGGWGFLEVLSGSGWGLWPPGSRWGYGLYPRVPVQQCSGLAVRRPEMGEAGSDSGLAGAPDLYLDFPHGRRVSYRIGSVLAVPHLSTMTPVIRTLPRAFEVFCRHAGPSASVVHTLATLREDNFDAVGPKRRLTPFCPIRGRTVVRKGDGLFDCIGFNNPGQFSYFVRDDNKYHFRLLCVSSTSLSNYFHNPATSTSLIHDRCGAPV